MLRMIDTTTGETTDSYGATLALGPLGWTLTYDRDYPGPLGGETHNLPAAHYPPSWDWLDVAAALTAARGNDLPSLNYGLASS